MADKKLKYRNSKITYKSRELDLIINLKDT